ncbi:hypothetical protein SCE1572_07765 [Sorangium cellulosum So0157-2]|uniref:Uncharacterized protein n=1 Tax=Sorangium cellulosum So0157-2 TaxID=1254432 RepID=S4XMK6_SORCE|nr:hypothetical protein SCE1572_07765 [Sorangium cellulosum So0157-2]
MEFGARGTRELRDRATEIQAPCPGGAAPGTREGAPGVSLATHLLSLATGSVSLAAHRMSLATGSVSLARALPVALDVHACP